MSKTYFLVCHGTRCKIWIGQGWSSMEKFYSEIPSVMQRLGIFLRKHQGLPLVVLTLDDDERIIDYKEAPAAINAPVWPPHVDGRAAPPKTNALPLP